MSHPIQTLEDLLEILESHPEWRTRLLETLLTKDFLELPQRVSRLEEALAQLTNEVRALAEGQRQLQEGQRQLQQGMIQLQLQVQVLVEEMRKFAHIQKQFSDDLSGIKGDDRERFYRNNASAIFVRYLRKTHVVDKGQLLEQINAADVFTEEEWNATIALDLLVEGVTRQTGRSLMIVLEVSWIINSHDVERAVERAAILQKHNLPAIAAVGGKGILPEARDMTSDKHVLLLLDGLILHKELLQ